jgi:phosphoribosylformylglycinamidine synthase
VSEGGVLVALLESAMPRGLGFDIQMNPAIRPDAWLLGESQSRVIVSIAADRQTEFEDFLRAAGQTFEHLGAVRGSQARIHGADWGEITDWQQPYDTVLQDIMN